MKLEAIKIHSELGHIFWKKGYSGAYLSYEILLHLFGDEPLIAKSIARESIRNNLGVKNKETLIKYLRQMFESGLAKEMDTNNILLAPRAEVEAKARLKIKHTQVINLNAVRDSRHPKILIDGLLTAQKRTSLSKLDWTTREMACHLGLSDRTVERHMKEAGDSRIINQRKKVGKPYECEDEEKCIAKVQDLNYKNKVLGYYYYMPVGLRWQIYFQETWLTNPSIKSSIEGVGNLMVRYLLYICRRHRGGRKSDAYI